jgi:uncharacterized protein (DUF1684 family)
MDSYPMDDLAEVRAEKNHFFKKSLNSPLTADQQARFDQLNYFDPAPELSFELDPIEFPTKESVRIQTSTGQVRSYVRWGQLKFAVRGEAVTLTLYAVPGQSAFFLPFMDGTTGTQTYGAGRYVEVERLPNGKAHLDFNMAYNPYCAYNAQWSCPLVPAENRVSVSIEAGEKSPSEEWAG